MKNQQKAIKLYNDAIGDFGNNEASKAIRKLEKAIAIKKDFFQAYTLLGKIHQSKNNPTKAELNYTKALRLAPKNSITNLNFANVLRSKGAYKEASKYYDICLSADPTLLLGVINQTINYAALDKAQELFSNISILDNYGIIVFTLFSSLEILPPQALNTKYLLSEKLKYLVSKNSDHLDQITYAFKQLSSNKCALYSFLIFLVNSENRDLQDYAKALIGSDIECEGDQKFVLGKYHLSIGSFRSALDCFVQSHTITNDPNTLAHVADTKFWLGEVSEAYKIASDIYLEYPDSNFFSLRAFLFNTFQFKDAWDKYALIEQFLPERAFAKMPSFDDVSTAKNILIRSNQGIGDIVMFLSTLNSFRSCTNAKITVSCDTRLVEIGNRSFPDINFIPYDAVPEYSGYDCSPLISDLCNYTRESISSFYPKRVFLKPNPVLIDKYKNRLDMLPNKLNIGVAWKGGTNTLIGLKQSKTLSLTDFAPLLRLNSINWINLQYGDIKDDLKELPKHIVKNLIIFDDLDPVKSVDDQMALISQLDLVIQPSNASIHFAGALGIQSWLLLDQSHDWRWFKKDGESLWYQNNTIFEKENSISWEVHIEHIANMLIKKFNLLNA